ncbi:DEKNAAC102345 [Brettanomyces naardenensis]|uniref:DEKNAAC102345 n=1 Tax=Brettanomyces naardenensis TaxID=13370 RepID=A0A448YKZ0_BRENA|nr:DEKNAAC102345 [Brettanomyces naardenensis]
MYAQSQGPLSIAGTAISSGASDQTDFQIKLQLKDAVIIKLQEELDKSRKRAQAVVSAVNETNKLGFEIPKNHEELYRKLVEKLQSTEKELEDTKNRLEALVTAIALNPSQSQYKYGRYDEQEIAHKIITKLQMLSEENEELSKLLSYGKAKEKDIEIGLLRSQNLELRDKLAKFESKGESPSTKLITSK